MGFFRCALASFCSQCKGVPVLQCHLVPLKQAQAHFRSLCIADKTDDTACFGNGFLQKGQSFGTFLMGSMGKVETSQIHAAFNHLDKDLFSVRCRTQSTNNLRFFHGKNSFILTFLPTGESLWCCIHPSL